jgi:hypothetical protein
MHFNCTVNQLQVLHLRDALELPYYDIHVCTTITLELHLYDALKLHCYIGISAQQCNAGGLHLSDALQLRCYLVLPSIKLLLVRPKRNASVSILCAREKAQI